MQTVVLTGKDLTIEQLVYVARHRSRVELDQAAVERLIAARELVKKLAYGQDKIYGFNTGVGANKDKTVSPEHFLEYNRNLIISHSVGVGPESDEEVVRAIMLVRLNTLLLGYTGIQPEIVYMFRDFLNEGIHPAIPERGSVGEGDIATLSHIGLAMIGEGKVRVNGQELDSAIALTNAGLKPIVLGPKDGLAILSSNAQAAGIGALVVQDTENILEIADLLYALSLEGLDGNVSPLHPEVYTFRPYPGQAKSAENVRKYLQGSFLWEKDPNQTLQDPLSFRCSCHIHGAVRDALDYVKKQLYIQLNSSDDNPAILLAEEKIISCGNFEPLSWVLGFEMLGIALSHLSKTSCYRTLKLGNENFTGLSRFLAPEDGVIAFGTIQKTFASLDTEIRHLANPASVDFYSLAGDIEDRATNSSYIVNKARKMIDNLYYILGIEALHAAQAIDLRKPAEMGMGSKRLYSLIRQTIPFLDKDRNLSIDIEKAYELFKSGSILNAIKCS